jgi:uncharacterized protein
VWINEIAYENIGVDEGEFVEVAGLADSNVVGWKVLLYNGNGKVYDSVDLLPLDDGDGAGDGLAFAVMEFKDGIQNGVQVLGRPFFLVLASVNIQLLLLLCQGCLLN